MAVEKGNLKCPLCGRPTSIRGNPYRPFCSRRCKMVDLGAWFKGDYYIKGGGDFEVMDEKKDTGR